jgi:hypothetical protein
MARSTAAAARGLLSSLTHRLYFGVTTLFVIICVSGIVFAMAMVPETPGVSLGEIEAHLRADEPFYMVCSTRVTPAAGEAGR